MTTAKSFDFLFNQFRNGTGDLAAGSVTFYSAGTTSLKDVYHDRDATSIAANPYTLTADGTATLFGSGIYRVLFKNSSGVTVYDYDNVECYAQVNTAVAAGSTHTAVNALIGDQTLTLGTTYNQYVSKEGDSGYTVTISPPALYTFADGTSTYVLYSDGETVQFILSGTEFYTVI